MSTSSDAVQDFLDAYWQARFDDCLALSASMDGDSPDQRHCRAIVALWRAQRDETRDENVLDMFRTAQQEPPENRWLNVALLAAAARCLVFLNRMSEAQRCARLLRQTLPDDAPPAVRGWVMVAESHVFDRLGQVRSAHELSVRACKLELPPGGNAWHVFRLGLAHTAMNSGELALAGRTVDELESRPCADRVLRNMIGHRRVRFLTLCGRSREGLALLAALPPPVSDNGRFRALSYRVRLLLAAGRCADAGAAIEGAAGRVGQALCEFLRAKVCLHQRDWEGVRDHTRRALSVGTASQVFLVDNARQLAAAELASGNARAARGLLRLAEHDSSSPGDAISWAALCLLEGRPADAARHFRGLLDRKDPVLLRESLRAAPGLSGLQIATLWTLAEELEPGPDAPRGEAPAPSTLVGESPVMREVRDLVGQYARLDETVLVAGETGTGKELVARMLHDRGPRAGEPFIAVNCAAISDTLIESELFGHVKGAFTGAAQDSEGIFAAAGKGTVFLDEISSMSPRLQAAMLRVLENGEVRPVGATRVRKVFCRIVAASNQPLESMMAGGEFRADLYYRLARLQIKLPPLRERKADIPLLVRSFLQRSFEYGEVAVGDDLLLELSGHSWPGNVRELRNEVERIVLLSGGGPVLHAGLFSRSGPGAPPSRSADNSGPEIPVAKEGAGRLRGRLGRLRELFRQHPKLTRAEVVRLLGCSPNSATGYLKALEAEGLIRRVCTSASLRTSYFVPCDEGISP